MLAVLLFLGLRHAAVGQPPQGSQLPDEENGCALCHGEETIWVGQQQKLYVAPDRLAQDVHQLKGVNCHDCHGGDPASLDVATAHAKQVPSGSSVLPFRETARSACSSCHSDIALLLRKSVHARAERPTDDTPGDVLQCSRCHGAAHGMLPVDDPRSPVCLNHQVETCGKCHEEDLYSYKATVHGISLFQSGLVTAAVCANCHGSHGIYYAADERSTLYVANVANTCGQCHQGIDELIEQSVHGGQKGFLVDEQGKPRETWERSPTCTDCHQGHRLFKTATAAYNASGQLLRKLSS